ncbi:MAG: ROK family protein, partial [Clostridiales bacterium]|nr:ROK family protein [Clostridiales bacterium]
KNLGRGLSVLVDILNPERIVIGGIFMRAHKLMSDRMDEEMKKECLPRSYEALQIVPAALGERIGDYGAVAAGSDF